MHLILVLTDGILPEGFESFLVTRGCTHEKAGGYLDACSPRYYRHAGMFVVRAPAGDCDETDRAHWRELLETLENRQVGAVMVGRGGSTGESHDHPLFDAIAEVSGSEELWGRLRALERYQRIVRDLQRDAQSMQRWGRRLNRQFAEVDYEMRLASRLQRDFLPPSEISIGPVRFSAIYRPADWLSGDIYDVARVDEDHVSFYVADAIGHGMAASLLTMFVKRSVATKRIRGNHYELLPPSATLAELNNLLTAQKLANSQFITICCGLLNLQTLDLQIARGGHPYPLLVETDGSIHEIKADGGLVGLFQGEAYPDLHLRMGPGQKLVLYSDGLEGFVLSGRDPKTRMPRFKPEFASLARESGPEMVQEIDRMLDGQEGSLSPVDDITVVVLEVLPVSNANESERLNGA